VVYEPTANAEQNAAKTQEKCQEFLDKEEKQEEKLKPHFLCI
jgi:predicted nucleic acid-binding Zn ribbon protein